MDPGAVLSRSVSTLAMLLIMANIAQCLKVLRRILAAILMVLFMMKLKHMARVLAGKHCSIPAAFHTGEMVSCQYCNSNIIRNFPVMLICLTVLF